MQLERPLWPTRLRRRGGRWQRLPWASIVTVAVPALVALQLVRGNRERVLLVVIALLGALGVVAVTWARPVLAATAVLAFLPVQLLVLAKLYDVGLPAGLAGQAGMVKELVVLTLVAVVLAPQRASAALDRLDRLALAFVALVTAYLVLALLFAPLVGDLFPRAPDDAASLVRSFRTNAAFVVLFLAIRRLPMSSREFRRIAWVALSVGVVVGIGGIVEYLDPGLWRRLVTEWAGVPRFSSQVLGGRGIGGTVTQPLLDGGGGETIRVSSFLFSPLVVGFYLLVPLGIGLVQLARRPTVFRVVGVGAVAGTIVLTSTRSAALAGATTLLASLVAVPAPWVRARARLLLTVLSGLFVATMVASTTGLATRFLVFLAGDDPSADGHREATLEALELVARNPLGLGLGSGPTVAGRPVSEGIISENSYLQVGTEVGVLGMVLFVALLALVTVELLRRARRPDTEVLVSGAAAAAVGLALGGLFLHVWTDVTTAWTFWGVAGVALAHTAERPA